VRGAVAAPRVQTEAALAARGHLLFRCLPYYARRCRTNYFLASAEIPLSDQRLLLVHGHEKSDLVIVAMKPANKARKAHCGGVCGGGRSGVGGAKGGDQGECGPAKHATDSEPHKRVTGAGPHTAKSLPLIPEVGAVCGKAASTDLVQRG
jgi:hypothetical protein